MGNQTLVPSRSEIQSVESYFLDLKNYIQFRQSMGSTTFMKTAKVNLVESSSSSSSTANQPVAATSPPSSLETDEQATSGDPSSPSTATPSATATSPSPSSQTSTTTAATITNPSPSSNSNITTTATAASQQQTAVATSAKLTQQLIVKQRMQALRDSQQLVVVKIFPKYDPSVRLDLYSNRVKEIKRTIYGRYGPSGTNCLPFADLVITDRAAFLFRQYVKYNLYDRLSTRPFLATIEKKWLAFQLLCAVNECHSLQIVHGDIKTENVLVNSFLWASLADFASYKPVYLSKNHPSADFNYYFDISRRRTCYIAPERFDHPHHEPANLIYDAHTTSLPTDPADFKTSMDIFSLGCVIAELFMERPLFDFAQLLAYREHKYSPFAEIIAEVADSDVSSLILSMISVQASERRTAHEYLLEQNDRAFPSYFVYLRNYVSRFVGARLSADESVCKLRADLPILLKNFKLNLNEESLSSSSVNNDSSENNNPHDSSLTSSSHSTSPTVNNDAFFILLSLLLAFVRKVRRAENKLVAVELMSTFAKFLDDSVVLDRIVPYYLSLLDERSSAPPIVKAHVIAALHDCLANVQRVDAENLTLFAELVFDTLDTLARDDSFLVRSTCAKHLAGYALTALRFLDMSFLRQGPASVNNQPTTADSNNDDPAKLTAYDKEHAACQYRIMELVMQLMVTDTATAASTVEGNAVRETLMRSHIERLCSFLGRARTTDFLLPHMITMLNEKTDWWVRAAFFDALAPVLACIGWESVDIVKSLLEQGLHDAEEFVIHRTLCALARLVELGLLDRAQCVHFLAAHVAPLLCHPSLWIRHGAVGFVSAVCSKTSATTTNALSTVDILCSVMPLLGRYLRVCSPSGSGIELVHLESPHVLFSCVRKPVARAVYDTCAQDGRADQLFVYLTQRSEIRQLNIFNSSNNNNNNNNNQSITTSTSVANNNLPSYIDCTDPGVQELFEHLCLRCGLVEEDEDKLLHMREFLDKQRVAKLTSSLHYTSIINSNTNNGDSDLYNAASFFTNNNMTSGMHLGGYIDIGRQPPQRTQSAQLNSRAVSHAPTKQSVSTSALDSLDNSPVAGLVTANPTADHHHNQANATGGSDLIDKYLDRAKYIYDEHRVKQFRTVKYRDTVNASLSSGLVCLASSASKWKPRGYLVLDAREHTREINRLARNVDASYFATCSTSESCVKIWSAESGVWDARSGFVKSVFTYDRQPQGAATAMPTTTSSNAAAAAASASPTSILNTDGGLFRPACISFYNKNSLAILCEDYRFYVIDFNASRTQYRLYSNERLFRSNASCRSLLCTCGGSSSLSARSSAGGQNQNQVFNNNNNSLLDRTTFYYLNKQRSGSSNSGVSSQSGLCNCAANYPVEMVHIDDTSSSWPFASTSLRDYYSYSTGARSSSVKGLFCYSSSTGAFSCIDMRSRSTAFDVSRDLRRGYVTAMCTDPWYTWLAMGTSTGHIELYDFRFMVPVRTFEHRARASVVRMCAHPMLSNRLCVSYQGNNELAVWNMETNSGPMAKPELVYWGVQSVPPLCQSQMANAYISGLAACSAFADEAGTNGLICASTDMKMRYIDLGAEPARDSYVISSAFNLQQNQQQQQQNNNQQAAAARPVATGSSDTTFASSITTGGGQAVSYEQRMIEGTRVLVEIDNTVLPGGGGSAGKQSPASVQSVAVAAMPALTHQSYFTQHQDAITDLCLCYNPAKSQPVMITASRDGCLKIWK
jgi:phosphoinositide-3-kinase regulatory subunit 4